MRSSVLPALLCALFLSAAAPAKEPKPAAPENSAPPALASDDANAQFHVMAGEMAAGRHMPGAAAKEFLEAVKISPDAKLAGRATALALAANDEDLAMEAAKRWLAIDPTNLDSREVITLLAVRKGDMSEAYEQCAAIIGGHPGGESDGFRHVALILAPEAPHKELALAVMQKLVEGHAQISGAHYALGLVALRVNNLPLAEKAAREAIRLDPKSSDARMLLAGVEVKQGNVDAADKTMDEVIHSAPNANELRMGYARLLLESQQRDRARKQFSAVVAAQPGNVDAHYALGLMALEDQKLDDASAQFTPLAAKGDRRNEAAYYLGRIEEIQNHPDRALAWYMKVENGTQAIDAAVRGSLMLGKLKRVPEARSALAELRDQFPSMAPQFFSVEGELLLNANEPDKAIELYNSALTDRPDNDDLLYGRSLALEKVGHVDLAEADLRTIVKNSKDDARALNALGYLLILHGGSLEEARKLLERALELEPDDAAVIDSAGWLQFKLGHLNEAKSLLRKAYSKTPDPEIAAHLGEVLWTLGDKEEAKVLLITALKDSPDHTVLKETLDRLDK